MSAGPLGGQRGTSNLVVTLTLVAIAAVGGTLAFATFRERVGSTTRNAELRPVGLTGIEMGDELYLSATLKNTGGVPLENVRVEILTGSIREEHWVVGSPPSFSEMVNPTLTRNVVSETHSIVLKKREEEDEVKESNVSRMEKGERKKEEEGEWENEGEWEKGKGKGDKKGNLKGVGRWTSVWKHLGENINVDSLTVCSSLPGESSAKVQIMTSDDGSTVKGRTQFLSLSGGTDRFSLGGLRDGRYVRVRFKLRRGSIPVIEEYDLAYSEKVIMAIEKIGPGETGSASKRVGLSGIAGRELTVKITADSPDDGLVELLTLRIEG